MTAQKFFDPEEPRTGMTDALPGFIGLPRKPGESLADYQLRLQEAQLPYQQAKAERKQIDQLAKDQETGSRNILNEQKTIQQQRLSDLATLLAEQQGTAFNREIPKKWLKTNARQCGIGYQVEIHNVDNAGQVAGYISKYFLKSEGQAQAKKFIFPRGLRRIEVSRDWLKLPDLKADVILQWHIQQTREGQLRRAGEYHNRGYEIVDNVKE